jgi:hypothetical protein
VSMRTVGVAASSLMVLLAVWVGVAGADHGPGVPIRAYAPRNADEAAILRLIRTVAEGWEQKALGPAGESLRRPGLLGGGAYTRT